MQSFVGNRPDGYHRLRHVHSFLDYAADFTPPELAIFCIDFGQNSDFSLHDPKCHSQDFFRGRPTLSSLQDQAERKRIYGALSEKLYPKS